MYYSNNSVVGGRLWQKVGCWRSAVAEGRFLEVDAARAHDRAAKKYHGESAALNFEP